MGMLLHADTLISRFAQQQPNGGMLTRKQVAWLLSAYGQTTKKPNGALLKNGRQVGMWNVQVWPNGAGQLILHSVPTCDELWCDGCQRFHLTSEIAREEEASTIILRCRSTGDILAIL